MFSLYIDPMSGVAIVNLIIAFVIALWGQIKNFFLFVIGKKHIEDTSYKERFSEFSILSEGNQYFSTFFPIIREFEKQKINLDYYTLDIDDKILSYKSEFVRPKFLGFSFWGFHKASKIKTKYLLCTTPNIGNKYYPIRKSKNIKNLIHVFHSISDISIYKKGSLDFYDKVFLGSKFQLKSIREVEKLRNLKTKKCIEVGFPYLDYLMDCNNKANSKKNEAKNILIASSWGKKGLLNSFDNYWIEQLISNSDRNFIIRPHPQSLKSEVDTIFKIQELSKKYNNLEIDFNESPIESMQKASILVSDTSSIRYDYAFIFLNPVITVNIASKNMKEYEYASITEKWDYNARIDIGPVVSNIDNIDDVMIDKLIKNKTSYRKKILNLRKTSLANMGLSAHKIVKSIQNIDHHD